MREIAVASNEELHAAPLSAKRLLGATGGWHLQERPHQQMRMQAAERVFVLAGDPQKTPHCKDHPTYLDLGVGGIRRSNLSASDSVIPWTRGKSELLRTALIEDGKSVNLELVIFTPNGVGPFPLAMFNHGSTGNGTNSALFTETWLDVGLADFLNNQGWIS